MPPSQTPWQEIFRKEVGQLDGGMVLKGATKFQRVAKTMGLPRDNHTSKSTTCLLPPVAGEVPAGHESLPRT